MPVSVDKIGTSRFSRCDFCTSVLACAWISSRFARPFNGFHVVAKCTMCLGRYMSRFDTSCCASMMVVEFGSMGGCGFKRRMKRPVFFIPAAALGASLVAVAVVVAVVVVVVVVVAVAVV